MQAMASHYTTTKNKLWQDRFILGIGLCFVGFVLISALWSFCTVPELRIMGTFFALLGFGGFGIAAMCGAEGMVPFYNAYEKWSKRNISGGLAESAALTNMIRNIIQEDGMYEVLSQKAQSSSDKTAFLTPSNEGVKHGFYSALISTKCDLLVAVNGDLMVGYESIDEAANHICSSIYMRLGLVSSNSKTLNSNIHDKIKAYHAN